jgi:hypothetical protein
MTHSSTSPPELSDEQVGEWLIDDGYPWDPSELAVITITTNRLKNVARQAYQAGADQELEACCETLDMVNGSNYWSQVLRSGRRPKPPSLKEQAHDAYWALRHNPNEDQNANQNWDTIRRALESIDD